MPPIPIMQTPRRPRSESPEYDERREPQQPGQPIIIHPPAQQSMEPGPLIPNDSYRCSACGLRSSSLTDIFMNHHINLQPHSFPSALHLYHPLLPQRNTTLTPNPFTRVIDLLTPCHEQDHLQECIVQTRTSHARSQRSLRHARPRRSRSVTHLIAWYTSL